MAVSKWKSERSESKTFKKQSGWLLKIKSMLAGLSGFLKRWFFNQISDPIKITEFSLCAIHS